MDQPRFITNSNESFYNEIVDSLNKSKAFFFSVAFISYSGLQLLLDVFKQLESKGIKGKVITSTYLNFTDPKSIKKLKQFSNIDTKVYIVNSSKGFHTKGYIFEYEDHYKVIVGSSNLTQTALKSNIEWNVEVYSKHNDSFIVEVLNEYNTLWELANEPTINFLNQYEDFLHELNMYVSKEKELFEFHTEVKPNKMQLKAMESLAKLREKEENKALVVSATGTGKTYMSAFDVLEFIPERMLFVVHREKILDDAIKAYKRVMPGVNVGKLTGNEKNYDADFIFASINTISRLEHLQKFDKYDFEYIVIDEAHRSVTSMYERVLNYFTPKFLLGMTATPERTDYKDVFEVYDNNVAIEIRLRDALENELVVPFHYFGITDITTDLSHVNIEDVDVVAKKLSINKRVDLIINHMEFYDFDGEKRKCLGFCVNIDHAKYMADMFNTRGYKAIALIGEESDNNIRETAINQLEDDNHPLEFIFTVNVFNEGIDIPSVNLVLMLRPTQSPIIFTQQLGRGLRKFEGKGFLTVLDFIGNHNKSFLISIALNGVKYYDKDSLKVVVDNNFEDLPGCSNIYLDKVAKERILNQLDEVKFNGMKYLREEYSMFKQQNKNKIPMMVDYLYKDSAPDPIKFTKKFKSYISFLYKVDKANNIIEFVHNNDLSFLEYITSFLPLRRIHEFVIIYELLERKTSLNIEEAKDLISSYVDDVQCETVYHSFKRLSNELYSKKERNKMEKYFVLEDKTLYFKYTNLNSDYLFYVKDVLEYGISLYKTNFGYLNYGIPALKLYEKYNQADTLILSNIFDRSPSSVREGVLKINNNYFIFINLHKDEKK